MTREHGGYTWTYDPAHRRWFVAGTRMVVYVGDKGSDGHTGTWVDGVGDEYNSLSDAFDGECVTEEEDRLHLLRSDEYLNNYGNMVAECSTRGDRISHLEAELLRAIRAGLEEAARRTAADRDLENSRAASSTQNKKYDALYLRFRILACLLVLAVLAGVLGWIL